MSEKDGDDSVLDGLSAIQTPVHKTQKLQRHSQSTDKSYMSKKSKHRSAKGARTRGLGDNKEDPKFGQV